MSDFTKFLQDLVDNVAVEIMQGFPAKIESYDNSKMRADVKPYFKTEQLDGESVEYPVIPKLPVLYFKAGDYFIKPPYEKDDTVWITFSTRSIRQALNETAEIESKSVFNMADAAVACGYASDKYSQPSNISGKSGLLLGGDKLYMQIDGKNLTIENQDGATFKMNGSALELLGNSKNFVTHAELNTALQTFITALNLHTHTGNLGSPTSPPTSPMTLDISSSKTDNVKTA